MGTLHINILGTSFSIQAKEDDAYLKELLSRYKALTSYIERSAGLKDNLKIAIMAGISLCDELNQIRRFKKSAETEENQMQHELFEAERITLKLIENIDKALK